MFVTARLPASNHSHFQIGRACKVNSSAFGDIEVTGKTSGIGNLIRNSYFDVSIKIDNTEAVSDFSNLQVTAMCKTD